MSKVIFGDCECSVGGCHEPPEIKDMCSPHYQRVRRTGSPGSAAVRRGKSGSLNPKWRGGKSSHPLYYIYHDMISRCHTPTHKRYADYGGRGIAVCERWRNDFWAFVADMGERPPGLTLDREDNDRGYGPDNCRWATYLEQRHNRRPERPRAKCRNGHEYTAENEIKNDPHGWRCRTCKEASAERRRGHSAPRNRVRRETRHRVRAEQEPRRQRRREEALAQLAADYYELGGDYRAVVELRARLGVSRQVIRARLKAAGITPPDGRPVASRTSPVVKASRFSEADRLEMIRLRGSGLSQRQIAQRFGTTQSHVAHILRGINTHKRPMGLRGLDAA